MKEETHISDQSTCWDSSLRANLESGRLLANAEKGEEIVITGLAGAFPNANDIHDFRDKLFNKAEMVLSNVRWDLKHPELPTRTGSLNVINQYDAGFFGVHERQSHSIDAMTRMFQEKVIEAIFDAGLHPSELENTRTGVFIGACFGESDKFWFYDKLQHQSFAFTGAARSMMANRISYFLKLKGPSYCIDTACSSSLYAFENAFRALRLGEIDNAIVGGNNLCLHPFIHLKFSRLGVLSKDGSCKVFDKLGNGYARSEAIGAVILQKSKNAKRIYAEVIYIKTNCDGHKEQGITFPSREAQTKLLNEFYEECSINRYDLSFLEAHGTGTFVGDPEECFAIDEVLTKKRKTPLLIGSVKSNIGHSEPASGVCSIIKSIIAMETGYIPPNLHYQTPRDEIKGLHEGRMKVVSEKMPFEDNQGLIGINNFGFGGGNCHLLLRWNPKEKVNDGLPEDDLPRLVCVSGRTKEAVNNLLDEISTNQIDVEHIKLLHEVFRKNIMNHIYRGYVTISKSGEVARSASYFPGAKTLYCAFGELNNWHDIGNQLMSLPIFTESIQRIQKNLLAKGIDILEILNNKSSERDIYHVVGSVAVQMCIVDILNLLEIRPKCSFGYSFGELVSAYYAGILTLEDTLNCAVVINESAKHVNGTQKSNGGYELHDVSDNHIVNGDKFLKTEVMMDKLKSILKSSNSAHIKEDLAQNLTNILGKNKFYNDRSADYFINALADTDFGNIAGINSVVLKIGDGSVHEETEDITVISFGTYRNRDYVEEFVNIFGRLYELGYNPQIDKLYPLVELPVSRGTRMISPYIKWKHTRELFVPNYSLELKNNARNLGTIVKIQHTDLEWAYILGHVVDGRNLFPAAGYLCLVWETLSVLSATPMTKMQVVFENCKFMRATNIPSKGNLNFNVTIQKGTGNFEINQGESVVVMGRISMVQDYDENETNVYRPAGLPEATTLPLKTKDVYKELRLRGYHYKGEFRAIQECDNSASKGYIKWTENWVTFIDNMLQMKILQTDSRLLYIPTFISKLTINARSHLNWITEKYTNIGKAPDLLVFNDGATGTISCGGIRIHGLIASSIARKKDLGIPVLENYKFVPNVATLNAEQSVRVNVQIILENALVYTVKAVEIIDEFTAAGAVHLTPIIQSVLQDQPLIKPDLKILSKTPLEVDVDVENKDIASESDCLIVIGSNFLSRPKTLQQALEALQENGFLISREVLEDNNETNNINPDITVLTIHKTATERLLLLRKLKTKNFKCIKIDPSNDFSWISKVQQVVKEKGNEEILLYSENEPNSGIIGLVNCLRREPETTHVKCMFIMDNAKPFRPGDSFCYNQIKKDMAFNIYKNGQWGTYRHLLLDESTEVESEHCFVNVTVRGDLSSLKWIEGPLSHNTAYTQAPEHELVQVHYAALNFRDVMTALGKISVDVVTQDRMQQECVQGFEFSGIDRRGNRITGMVTHGALSSLILADSYLTFKIPDSWTLEEAATIPVVYGTVVYGLNLRGHLKRGETILIHSGTGGVGQAAIRIALYYGCKVYTTVGTSEKREFLKKTYPQLKDNHIGNSHDESFEQMIYKETNGRGVDIVLNSLAEDKLVASIRCLAKGGRFIEIGKFDMANNRHINLLLLQKEASFHGIMVDQLFSESPIVKKALTNLVCEGMENGAVKPLERTLFKYNEVEQAFRFMANGKHMGKVLIQIRESEKSTGIKKFRGIARYFCNAEKTYVIAGGLGGFGLELADWLVLRGAKKLVLTSRTGIRTGYQTLRIRIWKSYGVVVKISNANITTAEGCKELIEESQKLGPIDAIFNLAVVLADAVFENQTPETFVTSFAPKAFATAHLDELTRKMCPNLSEFVVFSSVSCGRGNAGQTNYGMANSVMERICEKRREDGYPALAIEWGAIGEVGLVAEMQEEHTELEISGTLQQKISSCLKVLDTLLRQKNGTIVSSMVVAEKRGGANSADNIVDAVINILGLNDLKSISLHSTLAELGMDSMTGVEIKQTLEREFEVFLSAKDMRTMTLARLKEYQAEKCETNKNAETETETDIMGLGLVLRLLGDESDSNKSFIRLRSKIDEKSAAPKILLFPGIAGFASIFEPFTYNLNAHAVCIQFRFDEQRETILGMAETLMPSVEEHLTKTEPFNIVAYSFGTLVALEVVNMLESRGYTGTIICLDGAPLVMKYLVKNLRNTSEETFQTNLIFHMLSLYLPHETLSQHRDDILKCKSWEDRVNLGMEIAKNRSIQLENYQRLVANGIYTRLEALHTYSPSYKKLKSNIKLYKPKQLTVPGLPEDYNLSELFDKPVEIKVFEGDHATLLEDESLAEAINSYVNEMYKN